MKVFYTDYNKKSLVEEVGTLLTTLGIVSLVIGMLIMFLSGIIKIESIISLAAIGVVATMVGVFSSLIGMLFIARKICSNERRRVFICDDKDDLYLLETKISNENIKEPIDIESVTSKDLVFDMVDAMLYSPDKGNAANNFRDLKVIVDYLDSNAKAKIVDVKILKDTGKKMRILIQNNFGWKKELIVNDKYINYNDLATLLREKSEK